MNILVHCMHALGILGGINHVACWPSWLVCIWLTVSALTLFMLLSCVPLHLPITTQSSQIQLLQCFISLIQQSQQSHQPPPPVSGLRGGIYLATAAAVQGKCPSITRESPQSLRLNYHKSSAVKTLSWLHSLVSPDWTDIVRIHQPFCHFCIQESFTCHCWSLIYRHSFDHSFCDSWFI